MTEQSHVPKEYIKGFNQGYTLAKEVPELAKAIEKMPKSVQEKPQMKGIADGMKQFSYEIYINKLKSKSQKPNLSIKPNKGMNRN